MHRDDLMLHFLSTLGLIWLKTNFTSSFLVCYSYQSLVCGTLWNVQRSRSRVK